MISKSIKFNIKLTHNKESPALFLKKFKNKEDYGFQKADNQLIIAFRKLQNFNK